MFVFVCINSLRNLRAMTCGTLVRCYCLLFSNIASICFPCSPQCQGREGYSLAPDETFRQVTAVKSLLVGGVFGVLCNESKQTNKQAKNVGKLSAHQFSSVF